MKGRLENTIKTEKNTDCLLSELPGCVTEYYLNLSSNREPKSCLEYIRKIKKFLQFVSPNDLMNIDFSKITDVTIAKYMKKLETTEKKGIISETSFSYRKQNHTILNSFFKYMKKKGYVENNPMDFIEREVGRDHPHRIFLKEDDLKNMLTSVENGAGTSRMINRQKEWKERDLAILMLFMQTGIRETALSEINIEDINFDAKTLTVINKGHEKFYYVLSDKVLMALQEWLYHREIFMKNKNSDALFISSNKTRITASAISKIVRKYAYDALGYEISPHKLRAAYGNLMINKTGNLHLVSKLMGHKRPDTTEIYLDDSSKEDKAMAAEIITSTLF